jgi:hypothetical protein
MPDFGIFRGFNDKLFGDKLVAGQLPINLGLIGSDDFGIDPDAQAFFDRVTAAGGTLSATEQLAINRLVKQMKSDGIWSKMQFIYPMVGASAAACAQNLKSSSFTATFSTGYTFASTGVKGNGTSSFMNTSYVPSTNLSDLQNAHISIYSRTQIRGGGDIGVGQAGTELGIAVDLNLSGISGYANIGDRDARNLLINSSTGFFLATRTSRTLIELFQNKNLLATNTALNTTTKPSQQIQISKFGTLFSSREFAFASIGEGLNNTESNNFYDAVEEFQTTLSRQV